LLVMVLARATDVDAYTDHAEVEVVQKVLCEYLGEDISSADVRIAAKSRLYETAPLEKYVSTIGPKLPREQRMKLIHALVEVLRADQRVATAESGYFNTICEALELTFADVAGLTPD
ncbi:MAG: TerB family tellurite resistance protein, partial [Halioglobus sp.]